MVVPQEVQEAVREVAVELGAEQPPLRARDAPRGVERDHDVAEKRPVVRRRVREREDIRGTVLPSPGAVEASHGGIADDEDRELRLLAPERAQVAAGALAQAPRGGGPTRVLAPGVDGHGRRRSAETSWSWAPAPDASPGPAPASGYSGRAW